MSLSAVMGSVVMRKNTVSNVSAVAAETSLKTLAETVSKVQKIHHDTEIGSLKDNRNAPPAKVPEKTLF